MIRWSVVCCCFLAFLLCACSSDSDGEGSGPVAEAERTVLVYMAAANSLGMQITSGGVTYGRADEEDIAEMIEAAPSLNASRRLLVFRDRYEGAPALYELKGGEMILLKEYDRSESCLTPSRMRRVVADTRSLAPSRHLGIILWSHANGWLEDGTDVAASSKLKSFGVDRNRRMNVTSLAEALRDLDLEFIYFDCCLMGSVEVAYELRDCAPYIVASTSELPRPGMPYDRCLPLFMQGAPDGVIASADATYKYYVNHDNPNFRTCTISVIYTAALPRLAAATAAVYSGAPLAHQGDDVTNYNAAGRNGYWIDLGEYASSLATMPGRDSAAADEFESALADAVIYKASTPYVWNRYPVYRDSGLSTYVFNSPDAFTHKGYDHLSWAREVVSKHFK